MAGTYPGGLKAAETNKKRHGKNHYETIGRMGGLKSRGGGFASDYIGQDGLTGPQRARIAGTKGGQASRRRRQGEMS